MKDPIASGRRAIATALDDAFLEDRRPLRAGSLEITPSGSNRCRRGTGEQKFDSGPFGVAPYVRPGNPVIPIPLNLAVADLAAGSYRIEVRALHSSGADTVVRTADLEVD